MTLHSKVGASTCERWWNCPGSVAAVAALPPQEVSIYAKEGTAAHELAELCLKNGLNAADYIGQVSTNGFEFTDEMAEAVQVYVDVIRQDLHDNQVNASDLLIEHRFNLTSIDKDAFGTNDANMVIFPDKIIVYDYKHGQGVAVDVEENKQLMFYALGAIEGGAYDTIEVVIVQPRAIHRDGPVRRWSFSMAQLVEFGEELKAKIKETRKSNAPRNCGSWCKKTFCPAMATCPAVLKQVSTDAMVAFGEPVTTFPTPQDLTPQQLKNILRAIPLAEEWLKSVWAYAEQKANNGEHIDGFKLVRGREGNRKWDDEGRVFAALSDLGQDIFETKLKSPAAMEKQFGKAKMALVSQYITRSEGKVILVPEEDPRENVAPKAVNVFTNVENDIFS